jgi:WhiB family redox-sensing transcriptional regulator
MRVPWTFENPSCAEIGTDFFFPDIGDGVPTSVFNICKACPHLAECAEWGIQRERYGTWGGLSAVKRKKIRQLRGISLPKEERSA